MCGACFSMVEVLSHINLNVLDGGDVCFSIVEVLSHINLNVLDCGVCFSMVEVLSHINQNVLDCGVCFSMVEVLSHINPSCGSRARAQHRPSSLQLLGNSRKRSDEKGQTHEQ